MHEGLELMEKRAKQLQEGQRVPVLEREKTVTDIRVYGFSPTEYNTYSYWENPTDIEVDQNGTLYVRKTVELVRPVESQEWQLGDSQIGKR